MKKTFITNLALLVLLNLLIKPFWILGIDLTVQNTVGAADYGFYFALFNFSFLFNILLDFGITNYNNRNISQHSQLLSKYFSNIVTLRVALGFVYLIITFISAFFINYQCRQFQMLGFLTLNQFLLSFILYLRSNLAGLQLFRTDSFVSVLDRLLMILICSVLLWGNVTEKPFQIEWFVYTQTAAYLITAIITFAFIFPKLQFFHFRFDKIFFLVILKQSYPFALLTLLMGFYTRVDTVMIERLLDSGEQQAGIYAQSFRILDAVSMFAYLFSSLLLPMFSKMIKHQKPVNQLVHLAFLLLIVPSLILSISAFFYKHEIMNLLYHSHVEESAEIFGMLILGFIAVACSYIFGTLLTANGSMKALNYMAATGMVLNIGLNFVLIPKYHAYGAAISSLTTQWAMAIFQMILAKRIFKFRAEVRFISAIVFFIIGVVVLNILAKEFASNWFLAFSAVVILSLDLAFIIKLLNIKALIGILKQSDDSIQ